MKAKLQSLSDNDRGVSPVIGVILMVAITVILAAVIGTFVLGLGDSLEQTPQAQLSIEEVNGGIVINHGGGDALQPGDLRLEGGDTSITWGDGTGAFEVGETTTAVATASGEYTITVIHEPSSSIIVEKTLTV